MAVWFSIGLLSVVLNLPHCLSSAKQDHHITSVNSENVNDHLSGSGGENNKFSLVLFYAPWQKECERNVELMESLAINFRNRSDVFIGIADIYNDRKLASKFHIEDYCLVKYFVKGSSVAESYEGNRTLDEVTRFIERYSDIEITEHEFKRKMIELNEETFRRIVKDKTRTALVLFHAVWCTKCATLLEVVRNVAKTFQKESRCILAHIDGEKNYKIVREERVGVYPTFMFYPKNNKDGEPYLPGKFEEMWTEKNITKFMAIHCQAKVKEEKVEDKMMGRIDELDLLTRNFVRNQNENRRESMIRETVLKIQTLKPAQRYTADFYVKTMRQVLKEGDAFLDREIERFEKLSLKKMLPKDLDESNKKRNILQHFRFHRRDEL